MLIGARGRPRIVDRIDDDPRLPLPGERPRHGGAEGVYAVDQQGIDVRLDRIEVRRQEEPRPVGVLLVDVVHDLRVPHVVDRVHYELRLDLGERVPVAVVVVPDIVMIQLGWVGALRGRADRTVVPASDDRDTVGVERGHEPEDDVIEDRRGREPLGGHRGRAPSRRWSATRLLRRGRRSRHGGDRYGDENHQRAEHVGRRTYRGPARRRYGSLCSSTRRFCARPATVLLGAMYPEAPYPLAVMRAGVTPLRA